MTLSLNDFINKYNGHGLDFDGVYGYQCLDLMHGYITEVLGLSGSVLAAPTAYQAYVNGDPNFTKIGNTLEAIPQAGDIMFWTPNVDGVGSAGHVAVFISGNNTSFLSFDQNWPEGSVCHEQPHNYNAVAGWLRYNGSAPAPQGDDDMITDQGQADLLFATTLHKVDQAGAAGFIGQKWVDALTTIEQSADHDTQDKELQDYPNQVSKVADLTAQNQAQQAQIDALNAQLSGSGTPAPVDPAPSVPTPPVDSSPSPQPTPTPPVTPAPTTFWGKLMALLNHIIIGNK